MTQIVPSILTNSPDEFEEMIQAAELHFSSIHLDIADGVFVPNTTIGGIDEVAKCRTPLKIIAHLMISKPEDALANWLDAKVEGLIFHIESTSQMDKLIDETKNRGKKVGIALNPDTPIEEVAPFVDKVDFVIFMTVDPGFYGSEFREEVLDKIRRFKEQYDNIEIRVDGGINLDTAKKVAEAGADVLVAGSYFFKYGQDVGEALENMKKSLL